MIEVAYRAVQGWLLWVTAMLPHWVVQRWLTLSEICDMQSCLPIALAPSKAQHLKTPYWAADPCGGSSLQALQR